MDKEVLADLSAGEDGVEDDAEEVNGWGHEEDRLPLRLDVLDATVLFRDLLNGDRADHSWTRIR